MISRVIFWVTLMDVMCFSIYADDPQYISPLSMNITDQTQASIVITLLNNAKNLLEDAKKYAIMKTRCSAAENVYGKPMDCAEVREKKPLVSSGVHQIWPHSRAVNGAVEVYCDMEDDGGSWTVIQRRGDFDSEKDYFFQGWQFYKKGFGDRMKDFWLGNDIIFALTNQRLNEVKFTLTDWDGNKTYATYDEFWIDDEDHKYTVHVNGYRGTAGDSFSSTSGLPFTTKDQDNDKNETKNCAVMYKGAWWYGNCHASNLNGLYLKGVHESNADGVNWKGFRGHKYSLKDTVIKIRPKAFQKNLSGTTPL